MLISGTSFHCRVVLVGDASVGKTSLLNQLVTRQFNSLETPTIAANFQVFLEDVDGAQIEMQIWDTAGQEKFRALSPIYYRNALGAIVVYDVTNRRSFEGLSDWISGFTDVAGNRTIITLVGNKCDVTDKVVTFSEARDWAFARGYQIYQTSAKTNEGVKELFQGLAKEFVHQRLAKRDRNWGANSPGRTTKTARAGDGFRVADS
jgi:small GTP-binding protein